MFPTVVQRLQILGFPLILYFGEQYLSAFSSFFQEPLLQRIWDIMFYAGNSGYPIKVTWILVSVSLTVLLNLEKEISTCRSVQDVLLQMKLFGHFNSNHD
jgi:hypothetical protein